MLSLVDDDIFIDESAYLEPCKLCNLEDKFNCICGELLDYLESLG